MAKYSDLRKQIGKSLQKQRKAAGFKSAVAFARHMKINPNTYTDYEQGKSVFTYEQAWEFADALGCTLDEVGGRDAPEPRYADPRQEALNGYYESMNDSGRGALVESARLMSGSPDTRIEKDGPEPASLPSQMAV